MSTAGSTSSLSFHDAMLRFIAAYAHDMTEEAWALWYLFDIVLRGPGATPFEAPREGRQ